MRKIHKHKTFVCSQGRIPFLIQRRGFTQMTLRQNFNARPGMDCTIILCFPLDIMLNLTAMRQNFDTRIKNCDAALPV